MLPSQANFILATVPDGRGKDAYLGLKQQGILVRYFDKPGLPDKIRITVGTEPGKQRAARRDQSADRRREGRLASMTT